MILEENYVLSNGVEIPKLGFGTWQAKDGEEAYQAALWALEAGYRHIDTAYVYENEESIARAIQDSKIPREEIFITTKVPADIKTYEGCKEYFKKSLENLNTSYVDLYLIHAPWPWTEVGKDCTSGNIEVWKAMIELYQEGKIRAIGVSNFHVSDMEALVQATGVYPMANQIRFFIGNTQEEITTYCQKHNILVEAYSPLATGEIVNNEKLKQMAIKYQTTIPKICIRYCIERNTLPLPKSVHKERIIDNTDVSFQIDEEDMLYLNGLYHIASTRPLRD